MPRKQLSAYNLSHNLSAYIKKGGAYILEHKLP